MHVELAGEPQQPGRQSEDFAAATPEALVLLDGSSSPAGLESGCRHGTAWYVRRLGVHLLARLTDRADRTAAQCLADAIAETAALHGARCDLSHPNTPAAMVVAARQRGAALEYAVLGDSLLVLDREDGEPRVVGDNQPFPAGEALRRQVWATAPGSPERAALHMQYALAVRAVRNSGRGPWVAAALPRAAEHAETGTVPLTGLRGVAALSDGASRYVQRYGLGTWAEAMALLADSGPAELLARVRAVESSDPQCQRWPRGKPHDDATALYARPT
ncbi:protein phosphatase 2C domain-containing protein [Peterkaempfera bronchialis]|uniref:Integrase n=1 Tax=Peterkaempfera bronchialis TaxID=2126346 RepID=A0A345SXQ9_9ACTN|nr:protein phosphatase 2C domain-containing protein [Peterkaempfera bronchialis]AXI78514.1 integrase [Peterkaempfera bronchialis]